MPGSRTSDETGPYEVAGERSDARGDAAGRIPIALVALLLLVAVAIGTAVAVGPQVSQEQLLLLLGVVAGVAFALVAVNRFWWLILVLFAIRASLDVLKPTDTGGGLEAGTIVGVVFLAAAAAWLFVQWRSRELLPTSGAAAAMLGLGAAFILSVPGAQLPFESVQTAMKFVAVAVMFVVLEQIFSRNPERIVSLLVATFASLIVPAIVGLTQVGRADEGTVPGAIEIGRIEGTFVHPNMFAAYLVIIGLLAVALIPHLPRWRPALVAVVVVVLPLLILTYARGAWIGCYVGLVFIGLAQSRLLLIGVFVVTIVVALAVPSVTDRLSDLDIAQTRRADQADANSAEWRIDYWQEVLPLVEDGPVTGIGAGMIPTETPEAAPAHSAFVDVIVETGGLGVITLIWVVVALWSGLVRAGRRLTSGPPRGLTVGAAAIGLAILVQLFSESLLTQPAILWYALGPMVWSITAGRRLAVPAASGAPSPLPAIETA